MKKITLALSICALFQTSFALEPGWMPSDKAQVGRLRVIQDTLIFILNDPAPGYAHVYGITKGTANYSTLASKLLAVKAGSNYLSVYIDAIPGSSPPAARYLNSSVVSVSGIRILP